MKKNLAEEKSLVDIEYDEILKDMNYAWLLLIEGSKEIWFSKNTCQIDEENQIASAPKYFLESKGLI